MLEHHEFNLDKLGLGINKNILNEMDFVEIDTLSCECAHIFLEGIFQ